MRLLGRRGPAEDEEEPADAGEDAAAQDDAPESSDLLTLLDRLDHELTSASRIPLTGRLLVDEEAVYAILDQIRSSGQAGIRQARAIVRHRDQIMDESQQEAERIVADATARAEAAVADAALFERAERQSRELLDDAERRARETEAEADHYAGQVLLHLRERLRRIQSLLQEGDLSAG